MINKKLIFEMGNKGQKGYSLTPCDVPAKKTEEWIPKDMLRQKPPRLPEVSEPEVVRHYTGLSEMNHGVDKGFYPLGSCTMKYNPKINEDMALLEGFLHIHPLQHEDSVQGALELMYRLDRLLCEITGMEKFTLQPAAGAHGELAGLMIMKACHESRGESHRKRIIVPDSAHGTNPASAAVAGFDVVEVKSDDRGNVDIKALEKLLDDNLAGLMLTNPNTLGLFEENIIEIANKVHEAGGLLYYDGANANAILGVCRPGDMGFDIVHLNLHKSFSTPHGGGGPGSGPTGVKSELVRYLPRPVVEYDQNRYFLDYSSDESIGRIRSFFGNFTVAVRAYAYIMSFGREHIKEIAEAAVLNANYLMKELKEYLYLPYNRKCMHEFVLSAQNLKDNGISALDIAKRLLDFGVHPPTIYFPLIVKESIMVEPVETESRETLDQFADIIGRICKEALNEPEKLKNAPYSTPVTRLDETTAARSPVLRF